MRKSFTTRAFGAALLALALTACGPSEPKVEAEGAIVTLPAVPGHPGAGYFKLETNQEQTRLTAAASPKAGRIELHEPGMRRVESFAFSSTEPLELKAGGRHAMIFGLDPSLQAGQRIPLTLTFEGAPPITVEAEVRRPGDVHAGH